MKLRSFQALAEALRASGQMRVAESAVESAVERQPAARQHRRQPAHRRPDKWKFRHDKPDARQN